MSLALPQASERIQSLTVSPQNSEVLVEESLELTFTPAPLDSNTPLSRITSRVNPKHELWQKGLFCSGRKNGQFQDMGLLWSRDTKEQRISLGASERHCQLGVISLPVLDYAMDKTTSSLFHHRHLLLCQIGDNWENLSD